MIYQAHSFGSAPMGGGTKLASTVATKLATALGLEHTLLFPTGWAAGYGAIYGLVRPRDHVVIDGLAHNCLQHGALASTRNVSPFIHNDMESLRKRLERIRRLDKDAAILIVSEGLFSMDSARIAFITFLRRSIDSAMIPSKPLALLDADHRSASDMGIRHALLNRHARTTL